MRKSLASSSRRGRSNCVQFQALESRLLFCGYHDALNHMMGTFPAVRTTGGSSPTGGTHASVVVPTLNSKPGAAATIYLDFDGDAATTWGTYNVTSTPAYGGTASDITEIWTRVAEKFSIFNVNVTTVNPGTFNDKQGLHVGIGGEGTR